MRLINALALVAAIALGSLTGCGGGDAEDKPTPAKYKPAPVKDKAPEGPKDKAPEAPKDKAPEAPKDK